VKYVPVLSIIGSESQSENQLLYQDSNATGTAGHRYGVDPATDADNNNSPESGSQE
jgi:hypothetical protein